MTDSTLFDIDVAEKRSGINKHALAKGVRTKSWPHHRVGARVLFSQEDLDAIVAMTAVRPRPAAEQKRKAT